MTGQRQKRAEKTACFYKSQSRRTSTVTQKEYQFEQNIKVKQF